MKKIIPAAVALALALVALMPGLCAAKLATNHNSTLLRG